MINTSVAPSKVFHRALLPARAVSSYLTISPLPILPTTGGCKIEHPERISIFSRDASKGILSSLDFARDAQFCSCLWQAKLAVLFLWHFLVMRIAAHEVGVTHYPYRCSAREARNSKHEVRNKFNYLNSKTFRISDFDIRISSAKHWWCPDFPPPHPEKHLVLCLCFFWVRGRLSTRHQHSSTVQNKNKRPLLGA